MSSAQALRALGSALGQAAADGNWQEVQHIDEKLAALLASLRGSSPAPDLRQALNDVQQQHKQVLACCRTQSELLAEKMALSRRNREGASAYALFTEDGELR